MLRTYDWASILDLIDCGDQFMIKVLKVAVLRIEVISNEQIDGYSLLCDHDLGIVIGITYESVIRYKSCL